MNTKSVLILSGSSRRDGETCRMSETLQKITNGTVIDLSALEIGYFDYDYNNQDDDFASVVEAMKASDTIIFATPVYWYAMSAQMKTFFDRLSDLLDIKKTDGRALAGKETFMIANGTGDELPEGFEVPFKRTSDYFDMTYRGCHYVYTGRNEDLKANTTAALNTFAERIITTHEAA